MGCAESKEDQPMEMTPPPRPTKPSQGNQQLAQFAAPAAQQGYNPQQFQQQQQQQVRSPQPQVRRVCMRLISASSVTGLPRSAAGLSAARVQSAAATAVQLARPCAYPPIVLIPVDYARRPGCIRRPLRLRGQNGR